MGLAKVGLVNTVDLSDLNVLLLELGCCDLVFRRESLAVPAPANAS